MMNFRADFIIITHHHHSFMHTHARAVLSLSKSRQSTAREFLSLGGDVDHGSGLWEDEGSHSIGVAGTLVRATDVRQSSHSTILWHERHRLGACAVLRT